MERTVDGGGRPLSSLASSRISLLSDTLWSGSCQTSTHITMLHSMHNWLQPTLCLKWCNPAGRDRRRWKNKSQVDRIVQQCMHPCRLVVRAIARIYRWWGLAEGQEECKVSSWTLCWPSKVSPVSQAEPYGTSPMVCATVDCAGLIRWLLSKLPDLAATWAHSNMSPPCC